MPELLTDLRRWLDLGAEHLVRPYLASDPDWPESSRDVVSRLHPSRMRLRVIEVIDETPSTRTLRLERVDGPIPPFRAGQYLSVSVDVGGVPTDRPFSISSRPGAAWIDLTVKRVPGGFVSLWLLDQLGVGDEVDTSGPVGHFHHEPLVDGDALVFVAGGSGITPFMSMIREQEARGWPWSVHLLYGSRSTDDVIFGEELAALAAAHPERFRYDLVLSEPPPGWDGLSGFIDRAVLERVEDLTGRTVYVCGPGALYDLVSAELGALGVPRRRIRRELYGPPADVTTLEGWPEEVTAASTFQLEVEGRGSWEARAGESVLVALERAGLVVSSRCRSGSCGVCRIRVLSGKVFEPPQASVRQSDRAFGYVHACAAWPVSDLVIRLP